MFLGLKFSAFVVLMLYRTLLVSVFKNYGQICTSLVDEATGCLKDHGFAWGCVHLFFDLKIFRFCRSWADGSSGGIGFFNKLIARDSLQFRFSNLRSIPQPN